MEPVFGRKSKKYLLKSCLYMVAGRRCGNVYDGVFPRGVDENRRSLGRRQRGGSNNGADVLRKEVVFVTTQTTETTTPTAPVTGRPVPRPPAGSRGVVDPRTHAAAREAALLVQLAAELAAHRAEAADAAARQGLALPSVGRVIDPATLREEGLPEIIGQVPAPSAAKRPVVTWRSPAQPRNGARRYDGPLTRAELAARVAS